MLERIDGPAVRRWADVATAALADARAEIDALNVFPVPDSDTGTNLFLTLAQAREAVFRCPEDAALGVVGEAFARGALRGARGNSGVIVSQFLDGLVTSFQAESLESADGAALARALDVAQCAAWLAVGRPVDGTILSVARAAADAADQASDGMAPLAEVSLAALAAARLSLAHTPQELEVLRLAGVVDAGARGLVVMLEALHSVVTGEELEPGKRVALSTATPVMLDHAMLPFATSGGAFEVMFVVEGADGVDLAPELRSRMAGLGDSVGVVGGRGVWQVHVHTDAPVRAIKAGALGRQHQVCVRHLASHAATQRAGHPDRGLVVATSAPNLAADLARMGAVVLVLTADGAATPGEFLRAVADAGATEVVVLACSEAARDSATQAVALLPPARPWVPQPTVHVLDAASDVQVVAGVAVYAEAGSTIDQVRDTVAAMRTAHLDAAGLAEAASTAATLLGGDGEVLTVLRGAGVDPRTVDDLADALALRHPEVELIALDGGQDRCALELGVG